MALWEVNLFKENILFGTCLPFSLSLTPFTIICFVRPGSPAFEALLKICLHFLRYNPVDHFLFESQKWRFHFVVEKLGWKSLSLCWIIVPCRKNRSEQVTHLRENYSAMQCYIFHTKDGFWSVYKSRSIFWVILKTQTKVDSYTRKYGYFKTLWNFRYVLTVCVFFNVT